MHGSVLHRHAGPGLVAIHRALGVFLVRPRPPHARTVCGDCSETAGGLTEGVTCELEPTPGLSDLTLGGIATP